MKCIYCNAEDELTLSIEPLIVNSSTDDFGINDFLVLLGANGQGIRHQVVNEAGIALCKAVCRMYFETSSSESPA